MDYKQAFINNYGQLAQDVAERTGLDPSLVLGQIAHESGWGQHVSGNNIFGITPGGKLAGYPNVASAAQAYVDLINHRYANAATKSGIAGQAQAISAGGYGPDSGYGAKIANVAQSVIKAGYKPASASPDDSAVEQGRAIFTQMTGTPAPGVPNAKAQDASVDVSSDPQVDQGREVFKELTGQDAPDVPSEAPLPKTPETPQSPVVPVEDAGKPTAPMASQTATDTPTGPVSPDAAPVSPLSSVVSGAGQVAGNVAGQVPAVAGNVATGVLHGAQSTLIPQFIEPYLNKATSALAALPGVAQLDAAVPALGALDKNYSTPPSAADQAANEKAYQAGAGNTIAGQIGNVGGQLAGTAPITGPIGAAGKAVAGVTPYVGPLVRLGTNALQGGVAAGLTGGNVLAGAATGGVLGGSSELSKGAGALLKPGGALSSALESNLGKGVAGAVMGYLGGHLASLEAGLAGVSMGPVLAHIGAQFGAPVAKLVGSLLGKSVVPAAITVGKIANTPANPLQ